MNRLASFLPLTALTLLAALAAACSDDSSDASFAPASSFNDAPGSGDGSTSTAAPGDDATVPELPEAPDPDEEVEEPTCDDAAPVRLFISPDDSNSMASPVLVRGAIEQRGGPSGPIRPWEFFNYATFDYPAAAPGGVTLTSEMVAGDPGRYTLQIGVASEVVTAAARAPMNLTFVLDTSGSMGGTPIELLRSVARRIVSQLRAGDIVSMVRWDTTQSVLVRSRTVAGPNDASLLAAIDEISASGGTDLNAGLVAGYELAEEAFSTSRTNRILLVSDGGANAGVTDIDLIAEKAGNQGEDGIYMVGVGVGDKGIYNDTLMNEVTDAGKGAAVFIDSEGEAEKMFATNFVNTMSIAVRDVQVQLDLPPGFEIVRFSGEEFSTDPEEIEPQHLAPNDAMVFHQELETCAPELIDATTEIGVTVRYKDAITFESREVSETYRLTELVGAASPNLLEGAALMRFTEYLTERSTAARSAVEAALAAAQEANPNDPDLAEIERLLGLMN
ncbi:MAG: VWA domain-containing protein [Myxococcota bacterium]